MSRTAEENVTVVARRRGLWIVTTLLLAILVVRVAVAVSYTPPVTNDQAGYEASAYRLATTGTFAYPTSWSGAWSSTPDGLTIDEAGRRTLATEPRNAFTMPGYPGFRALILMLTGDGESWRTWTRVAQAILSTLGALLMYLMARRYSRRAGIIVLLISLVYQPLITANSHLLTEVLFTYLLVACVYAVVLWSERRTAGLAAVAGTLFGLAFWVRPTVLPWAIVAATVVLLHFHSEWRRVAKQLVVAALVVLAVISPWWIRNYDVYGRFVPLSTSGSSTTILALQIDATHQWPFPWQSQAPQVTPGQSEIAALTQRAMETTSGLTERGDLAVSDALAVRARQLRSEILQKHLAFEALRLRTRSALVALAQPYAYVKWSLPYSALTGVLHYLLLGAVLVAVFVLRRRMDARLVASVPLYLIAIHAIIIPFNRYVFPAMPFAVILASALCDRLIGSFRHSTYSESPGHVESKSAVSLKTGLHDCPYFDS